MPYVWRDEVEDGDDVRDVVERADYDAVIVERDDLVTERDGLIEQRDGLIQRAEEAEEGWRQSRNKYADAFITSAARAKKDQRKDTQEDGRASTFGDLFKTRGDYGAY